MKDLNLNIQETALLLNWEQPKASDLFKKVCYNARITYKPGMRVPIQTIVEHGGQATKNLIEKAEDINRNYFKLYESRMQLLGDKKCIETGLWGSSKNAPVKVFLKPEDIATIEHNWKTKREQHYSQTSLFDVTTPLYVPRKTSRSKSDKKVSNPN